MGSRFARGLVLSATLTYPACTAAQSTPASAVRMLAVGPGSTSIVDDERGTLLATVPHPPGAICAWWPAADGSRAILGYQGKSSKVFRAGEGGGCNGAAHLQVLDLVELRELAVLPLEAAVELAAVTPDGKLVVIASEGKRDSAPLVSVDAVSGKVAGRITLPEFPDDLEADANVLMAVLRGEPAEAPDESTPGRIDLIDLPALRTRRSLVLPGPIAAVFWNRERTLLYALDQGVVAKKPLPMRHRRVYVVDPTAAAVVAELDLGPPSTLWQEDVVDVVPTPDHQRYLVLYEESLEILDGALTKVLGTVKLAHEEPRSLSFLNASRVYLGYEGSGKVSVLDLIELKVLAELSTGGAAIKFGKIMLLAGGLVGQAVLASIGGPSVQHETSTAGFPAPDGQMMVISNSQTEAVTIVDARSNKVVEELSGVFAQILADGRTLGAVEVTQLNLYDTVEHKLLPPLPLTKGGAICPDGQHIWTGSPYLYRIDLATRASEKPLRGVTGTVFFVVSKPT